MRHSGKENQGDWIRETLQSNANNSIRREGKRERGRESKRLGRGQRHWLSLEGGTDAKACEHIPKGALKYKVAENWFDLHCTSSLFIGQDHQMEEKITAGNAQGDGEMKRGQRGMAVTSGKSNTSTEEQSKGCKHKAKRKETGRVIDRES